MNWKRLDYNDISEVLAYDEIDKLNTISLSSDISEICQKQLDTVADTFRGAFRAKGYTVDVRDHYMPPEYKLFALQLARQYIWTRFPFSNNSALDEVRRKEYEEAYKMMTNPTIGPSKPDYSDDPELSGNTDLNSTTDAALKIPLLRFPAMFEGFPFLSSDYYWHF